MALQQKVTRNRSSHASEVRSAIAPALLFVLLLIIGIGPRISLGFVDAEIRVQDIILIPLIIYLLLSRKPALRRPLYGLLGNLLPLFLWMSLVTVLVVTALQPEVPLLQRAAYYGRTVEMIILAAVVAGLYLRSGGPALSYALNAISLSAILNAVWFAYQVATQTSQTLFGLEYSSQIVSYGPRLLGEPSAFGVGQYWAFIGAVSLARLKTGNRPLLNVLLLLSALGGAWLAESRISLGSILILIGLALLLGKGRKQRFNIPGIICGAFLSLVGFVQVLPELSGRLTPDAIQRSLDFRIVSIWQPSVDLISDNPLTGVGPGGLDFGEAHNILLRAILDFGIVSAIFFLLLFVRALVKGFQLAHLDGADPKSKTAGYIGSYAIIVTLFSGLVQDSLTAVMSSHLTMAAIGILAAQLAIERAGYGLLRGTKPGSTDEYRVNSAF